MTKFWEKVFEATITASLSAVFLLLFFLLTLMVFFPSQEDFYEWWQGKETEKCNQVEE